MKPKITYNSSPLSAKTKETLRPEKAPETTTIRQPSPTTIEEPDEGHNFDVPPEFLNRLATFPLFNKAPKSFHSRIAAELTLMQYHSQGYIIKKGDPSKSMYWILKGTVAVTSTDGESVYAELAPGDFFGEIGILFNRPRTATVIARTKVLVGVLTSNTLNKVLRNYPLIERRIRDEAQERLAMLEKKKKYDLPSVISNTLPPTIENHLKQVSPVHLTQVAPPSLMNGGVEASALATNFSPLPGPSIPPITHSPSPLSTVHSNNKPSDNVDASVSIQDFITSIPLFQNLPSDIIHKVALEVEPLHMSAFKYVFHKGETDSDMFFVIKGELEVIEYSEDPSKPQESTMFENILGRLGPGAYFGEMSFLLLLTQDSDPKRSASVRTISSTELMVVKSHSLKSLCAEYPSIADDMRKTAYERNLLNQSTRKKSLEKSRLSINYLINDNTRPQLVSAVTQPSYDQQQDTMVVPTSTKSLPTTPILPSQSLRSSPPLLQPRALREQPTSLFSSNWDFQSKSSTSSSTSTNTNFSDKIHSRSVSPITVCDEPDAKKRPSPSLRQDEVNKTLQLDLPPSNPISPSLNHFQSFSANNSRRSSMFQYLPHNKRMRLASVSGPRGRRRSSALSYNGPLPDKILLRVFEFLPLPDLMKLRLISKRWRQILHAAPSLFKTLSLTQWNTSIDDEALKNITNFVGPRPQKIDISNCFHITDEGFSYMVNEIGIAGKIKTIKMKSNWEVSAMAIMDLTVPSVGKHLEEIDLSNCRKVRDNVLKRLVGWDTSEMDEEEMLKNLKSEELDYDMDQIGCKNLKIINVGYCKHLTDNFMFHLAYHANQRLESLDLTRCTTITDRGFQSWMYRPFPNLKKLSLKDCTFLTDRSIIAMANACPNIEILDLNFCCALSDVSPEALCLRCPNIRELDLSFCGSAVSDSTLLAISLHLKKLERLILKGCIRVTRAGIDALLSGATCLSYLNVRQCKNAHIYPGGLPAQKLNINAQTKSAFVTAGPSRGIIEIVI